MLGDFLADPDGFDGETTTRQGLGLLPLTAWYVANQREHPGRFTCSTLNSQRASLFNAVFEDCEICHARAEATKEGSVADVVVHDDGGQPIGWQCGSVLGLFAQGTFESIVVLQALFGANVSGHESTFESLADIVEDQFHLGRLDDWLGTGRRPRVSP